MAGEARPTAPSERRLADRGGDAVFVEIDGPPITRCQSRYSSKVQCTKPPHGPDDQWHRNGAVEWHSDAEEPPHG